MVHITDYSMLFQMTFGTKNNNKSGIVNPYKVSDLTNRDVQAQLRAAGIDTNSKQFKTVVRSMMEGAGGRTAYTNIQGIKNRMSQYDSNGDYIIPDGPFKGITELLVTDENIGRKNRIIDIPESSREEMFQNAKREFLQENGVANGDTTKRSDVYANMYRKVNKDDRLAAEHTLGQYERAYNKAFADAVKAANPKWQPGMSVPRGVLEGITREDIEKNLVQRSLVQRSLDVRA